MTTIIYINTSYFKSSIVSVYFSPEELKIWEEQRKTEIISVTGLKSEEMNSYFLVFRLIMRKQLDFTHL